MEYPEIITRLPEADLPFPSESVRGNALRSEHGQMVFFRFFKDFEVPAHSHGAQWGAVLEGRVELTIGGETRTYVAGDSYHIPAGVVHRARIPAGARAIDFFEEPDRYRLK